MTSVVNTRRALRDDAALSPAPQDVAPAGPRHYLRIADLTRAEIDRVLDLAAELKLARMRGENPPYLAGKVAAQVFQKPSLRTRVSFEVAMLQLGGHALYLSPAEIQLGQREGVADAARVLSRYVDVIIARVFLHRDVEDLASAASVPVVNALSDLEHPCQVMADLLTLRERHGPDLGGLRLAYVGDGNNVAHSLAMAGALMGMDVRFGCPDGFEPDPTVLEAATQLATNGGSVELFRDPRDAVRDADAVYTDAWYSMGQEDQAEVREPIFKPYQVNADLLSHAARDVMVLHCLPAHRNHEITDEVIDGPASVVYDEAENRLHAQKALLVHLLSDQSPTRQPGAGSTTRG